MTFNKERNMSNLFEVFVNSYELGQKAARKAYGGKTQIHVKQYQTNDATIRMERLDNGTIHNIGGRSIPF